MMKKALLGLFSASLLLCVSSLPASSAAFRAGTLTCMSNPRIGLIIGSRQTLRCVFRLRNGSRQYIYEGTVRRIGLDLGITPSSALVWRVFARNSQVGRGTLRGNYVGASGSVAFGPGLGANVLIGGSRRTVMLQPLSLERQIGVSLAAGIATLTLR
jgi:hypothetical protein